MPPRVRVPTPPPQGPNLRDNAELAHLSLLAGDVIEALPTSLTRSLSDLKELDAVLSGSLSSITGKLNRLMASMHDSTATPQSRLELLKEVAEEASAFKLGGEDKIRVATGTCETIVQHTAQLDLLTSLMTQMMPPSLLNELPASTCPTGYPRLFPSYAAATSANETYTNTQFLNQRTHKDWFPPAQPNLQHPTGAYLTQPHMHPSAVSRAARDSYNDVVHSVERARAEHKLHPVRPAQRATEKHRSSVGQPTRKAPPKKLANNWYDHPGYSESPSSAHFLPPPSATKYGKDADAPPLPRKPSNGQSPKKNRVASANPAEAYTIDGQNARQSPAPSIQSASASATGELPGGIAGPTRKRPRISVPLSGSKEPGSATMVDSPTMLEGDDYLPAGGQAKRKRAKRAADPSPGPSQSASPVTTTGRNASKGVPKRKTSQAVANDESDLAPTYTTGAASRAARGQKVDVEVEDVLEHVASENERTYCYCDGPSLGEMVACDGPKCVREWFHLACAGLEEAPAGSWFCLECKPPRPASAARR